MFRGNGTFAICFKQVVCRGQTRVHVTRVRTRSFEFNLVQGRRQSSLSETRLAPPFCRRPDLETSPQVTLSWGEDRGEHALERSGRLVGGPECSVSPRETFMQPGVFICELSYPLVGEFQTSAEGCAR